jgi:hypothetical protein
MEMFPEVIWAGSFDEELFELITVFASANLPEQMNLPAQVSIHGYPSRLL